MFILKENNQSELEIKNSKFICLLYRINSLEEVDQLLKEAKILYPKATHYCYSYLFEDKKKSSDDNEPGGTAGMPILSVLEHEKMVNTLCIVIRYFGGIKLGTGGLVRAYSKSVKECLNQAEKRKREEGLCIKIKTDYKNTDELNYLLREKEIIKKEFTDKIIYIVKAEKEFLKELEQKKYPYEIIEKTWIEKDL